MKIMIPKEENKRIFAVSCSGNVDEKYLEYEFGSEFENVEPSGTEPLKKMPSTGRVVK